MAQPSQMDIAKQQLASAQRQAQSAREQVQASRLQQQSRAQLLRATPQSQVQYKASLPARQRAFEAQKKQQLASIKEYETKVIQPYQQKIMLAGERITAERAEAKRRRGFKEARYEKQQSDIASGKLVEIGGKLYSPSPTPSSVSAVVSGQYIDPKTGLGYSYAPEIVPSSYVPIQEYKATFETLDVPATQISSIQQLSTVETPRYQGPTRVGTDVETYRRTGKVTQYIPPEVKQVPRLDTTTGAKIDYERPKDYTKDIVKFNMESTKAIGSAIAKVYRKIKDYGPPIKVPIMSVPGAPGGISFTMSDVEKWRRGKLEKLKNRSWKEGIKQVALETMGFILPETYGEAALQTGAVYAGAKVFPDVLSAYAKSPLWVKGVGKGIDVGFLGYNIKTVVDTSKSYAERIKGGLFAGLSAVPKVLSVAKKGKILYDMNYNPNYVTTFEEAGKKYVILKDGTKINLISKYTEPINYQDYIKLMKSQSGKNILNVHVTNALDLRKAKNILLEEKFGKAGASAFRKNKELYSLYMSASNRDPNAYLGYVGILGDKSKADYSKVVFGFKDPKIEAIVIEGELKKIPENVLSKGFEYTRDWIRSQGSGKYPAVENILATGRGMSTEGQIIAPAKSEFGPGQFLELIDDAPQKEFTYYKQFIDSPFKNKWASKAWDVFTSKYKDIDFLRAKLVPVGTTTTTTSTIGIGKEVKKVDVVKYMSSYGDYYVDVKKLFPSIGFLGLSSYTPTTTSTSTIPTTTSVSPTTTSVSPTTTSLSTTPSMISFSSTPLSYKKISKPSYKPSAKIGYESYKPVSYKPSAKIGYESYKPVSYKPSKPSGYKPEYYKPSRPRTPTTTYPYIPGYPYTPSIYKYPRTPTISGGGFIKERKRISSKKKMEESYVPFVKKGGKEIIVGRPTVKGRALRIGETIVRKTAAATFGVKKTGKKIKARKDPYAPSPLKYRAYKVVKGKKVPIKDTFIEKRKYRISTPGERKEITRKGIEKRSKKIW